AHPQAAALIQHSFDQLGERRLEALSQAYAAQPASFFDDMEVQIAAVLRASGRDFATCLADLDAFNALTPEVENDAWYDADEAFTSMHLDALLLGFARRRLDAVARQIRRVPLEGASFLDVGSGSGRLADLLLDEHRDWRGALADRSAAATRFASGYLQARDYAGRATCHQGSLARLPFAAASFDVVIAAEVLEHTDAPQAAVAELMRVMKPEGRLAISLPIDLDIAMHPTVFTDQESILRFFGGLALEPVMTEVVAPDDSLDAICDVFPGFRGCLNAVFVRSSGR
ncbi:MAG: class I SAM-dependent methyltransferase, partial [Rhizobacter sp.]